MPLSKKSKKKYDVVIIGQGITGLSTAYHLMEKGIDNLAIIHDPKTKPCSLQNPGFLAGGLLDNYSRVHTNWGPQIAQELWNMANRAFSELQAYADLNQVAMKEMHRLRLIQSEHELKEAKKKL